MVSLGTETMTGSPSADQSQGSCTARGGRLRWEGGKEGSGVAKVGGYSDLYLQQALEKSQGMQPSLSDPNAPTWLLLVGSTLEGLGFLYLIFQLIFYQFYLLAWENRHSL